MEMPAGAAAVEAAVPPPADSLYAVLNVSRTATDEELKVAYRRLCVIFHPDKHTDPARKDAATAGFRAINEAYEVLSNPGRRAIYDLYGLEGLQRGYEVGPHLKTTAEIRAEYERLREMNELAEQQRAAASKGECSVRVDASTLINPYFGDGVAVGLAELLSILPEIRQVSVSQELDFRLSPTQTAGIQGSIVSRNGAGVANLVGLYRQHLRWNTQCEVLVGTGSSHFVHLKLSKDWADQTTVTGTVNLVLLNHGLGASFNATVARPLGGRWGGFLRVEGGMQPVLSVGLTHGGDSHSVRTAVQLAPDRVGLEVQGAYQADADTRLKAKASVSTAGAGVVVGAERALNDISRVGASLEVGTRSGVLLRFRYARFGQAFVVPVLLDPEPSWRALAVGVVAPTLLAYLLKTFVWDPRAQRQRRREAAERRAQTAEATALRRREALDAIALMTDYVRAKVDAEERRNGLIIVEAVYGVLNPPTTAADTDPGGPLTLNVTIPLQSLVVHSQLHLHAHSKAALVGFYDPCVGEAKQLRIIYIFQRQRHEVTLNDLDAVALPLRGTPA